MFNFVLKTFKKRIAMKTEEKTRVVNASQIVFRSSAERRGYYRFHYGHLTPDGTFAEDVELSFWDYLKTIDVPVAFVTVFEEKLDATELEVCNFGYFSQERFDDFMHCFVDFCDTAQLYPGMLVLTFNKEENED